MTETHGAGQSGQLAIGHTTAGGVRVITLHGEIDRTVKDILTEALLPSESTASPRMVADLSGVTFMDSSGINVFLAAQQAASEAQGWLRIAGAQGAVLRILRVVGLDTVISFHPSVEQALTA